MSASSKKYDVFISFRGQDTRETFTSHLHYALCKENIITYTDDNLLKGDEISEALAQAILDSRISLVVFSKYYATSKWCLNELLKILECRKNNGQVVIPVFYNIDPSHVRKQTGSYGEVFAKYEGEVINSDESFANTVSEWRAALAEAANIPGWDSQCRTYKDDSQVIESIVNDVWKRLALMYPNELKGLVHNDKQDENVELLLKRYPRIGIWGMGGIGKTTIARQMFATHFAHYDSTCFMENVNEEVQKFGLKYIRNKLLSELLKRQITDDLGPTFIERMLSGRKVFFVLDDVGNAAQLEYLYAELEVLGPNSRLIITTRDRHTLRGKVDRIYEVTKWNFEESLRLFSLGAFKQNHPKDGYKLLSQRAVAYAGGIPLALKVLGSHFYSRSSKFWESELKNLENKGESFRGIQEVLKLSYNGLTVREKEMFLDIAFIFKDYSREFVTRILDASGIDILEDKALITISYGRILMHDLLQQMAFDIVRQKKDGTCRDTGKRSRLRDNKEVCDVFKNSKGTLKVEGIIFDLSQKGDLHVRGDTFNMMTNLRFLKLHTPFSENISTTIYHPEDMMSFSDKLRYFQWDGCPLKSLPQPFCAELLVEIQLSHSNVEYLWHGKQELVNLELMNLEESKQLMKLPDLSGATKLKWLYLSGCESLCEVHPSVFSKDTLVTLLVDGCKKLEILVSEKHLTTLQKIDISGCSSLREFSLSSDLIEELDLSNTGIEILHSSIGRMSKLRKLGLQGLRLKNLPKEMSSMRSLTELDLSNCNIVTKSKLEVIFDGLESLKILSLKDCSNLLELPVNIDSLSSMYELRLDGSNVKMLPTSIKNLSGLHIMSLDNCKSLACLPELPPGIKVLLVNNCTSLVNVSSLKAFSQSMKGWDNKYILFKNSMKLDRPSQDRIMKDVILTIKSAAFHNTVADENGYYVYNNALVCLPGRRVPRQFKFRTIGSSSSITIELPQLSETVGFVLSVVVSPSYGMKEHGNDVEIICKYSSHYDQCHMTTSWSFCFTSHPFTPDHLSSDHVLVWLFRETLHFYNQAKVFKLCVTTATGEQNDFYILKECGICPIYYSEFPRFATTMNLDRDLERKIALELSRRLGSDLNESMQFESDSNEIYVDDDAERELGNEIDESIERCDENERAFKQKNQQDSDSNKKCSCSSNECLMGPLIYLWRLIRRT